MIGIISIFSDWIASRRCGGLLCSTLVVILALVVYLCIYIIYPNKESSASIKRSYDYVIGNSLILYIKLRYSFPLFLKCFFFCWDENLAKIKTNRISHVDKHFLNNAVNDRKSEFVHYFINTGLPRISYTI